MRSRPSADDRVTEVTRRRLAALTAELAEARGEPPPDPDHAVTEPEPEPLRREGLPGRHARRPVTPAQRLTGWIGDRLPPALQGRPHLGSAQVGLVCLVVAVGLVLGAWWLVRAGGSGVAGDVVPPRPVTAPSSPGTTTGTPSAVPQPDGAPSNGATGAPVTGDQIVVDVVGKVRRPGIVVLAAGSRVVDAVRAAGGVRRGVDRVGVNMARLLTDGEQVLVGVGPAPGQPAGAPSAGAPASGALVNINTADQATLETLPGVGPVTAAAILEWRAQHGGFTAVEELLEVSGIGDATLAEIAPHVTL